MEPKKDSNVWKWVAIIAIAVAVVALIGVASLAGKAKNGADDANGAQTAEAQTAEVKTEQKPAEDKAKAETTDVQSTSEKTEGEVNASSEEAAKTAIQADDYLVDWLEDAPARLALAEYVEDVTDESSANFIPVEDRVAVFDMDGTLFCETDPNYFDYMLLVHRVLEDEEYKDKASDYEKETAQKIVTQNETGESFDGLETDHGKCIASAFAGMTPEEFSIYIQQFKETPMNSYDGMSRGDGWYEPMVEVVDYLKANDFTVYVVSGTDRFIVRGLMEDCPIDLPKRQLIGSDERLVATGQGDTDGLKYQLTDEDEVVLSGEFIIKNLKMNKVTVIMQEIGDQPVLSFGNSTGDSSMARFVVNNNPYRSMAFMLCCDDTERENGNVEKADKMKALCEENQWMPISMKDDWYTIYGEGVTKKPAQKEETAAEAPAAAQ